MKLMLLGMSKTLLGLKISTWRMGGTGRSVPLAACRHQYHQLIRHVDGRQFTQRVLTGDQTLSVVITLSARLGFEDTVISPTTPTTHLIRWYQSFFTVTANPGINLNILQSDIFTTTLQESAR
jgi:hypothetical protein